MPRGVRKADLPTKICASCGRPFTWRKKWARDWDQVRFCSDRCRRDRPAPAATGAPAKT
ncbi:MAG: DUF2256 domain-containing protein [Alkalilacustris sp.]